MLRVVPAAIAASCSSRTLSTGTRCSWLSFLHCTSSFSDLRASVKSPPRPPLSPAGIETR